jgi:hypothetical protein
VSTDKHVPRETLTFDWQKIGQAMVVPQGIKDLDGELINSYYGSEMLARMTAYVLTEKLPPAEYVHMYPGVQTWWDRLKIRLMGHWGFRWLERFPARPSLLRTTIRLEPFYVYPDASLPHEVGGERAIKMHRLAPMFMDENGRYRTDFTE